MRKVGIITVSDRSSRGERDDLSGPEIKRWAERMGYSVVSEIVVPDELDDIAAEMIRMSDEEISLVLTTGGTGFAPRDVTPEATLSVIEKRAAGFAEVMRAESFKITPHAMLSRAESGIRKKTLIVNLPGSPKAVRENLGFIEKAIPHALDLIRGDVSDCGSD